MDSNELDITEWLRNLEEGHDAAAQQLWNVFFDRMVRLAEGRMRATDRRVSDAEDIALSAFASFCRGAENQRFTQLSDRDGLWRLLVCITIRKLSHTRRDQNRLKRGGSQRQVESTVDSSANRSVVNQIISREPTPEFAAQVAEEHSRWMMALDSDELVQLAEWKLEGFTNEEIAAKWGRTTRTVERKLNLIRKVLVHEFDQ
jgi:DNA-directed RNA polymerase specialized sigma24 family protein